MAVLLRHSVLTAPCVQVEQKHLRGAFEIAADLCKTALQSARPDERAQCAEMWVRRLRVAVTCKRAADAADPSVTRA
jgi:hypothetical protein